jgi:hypothetical protein
MLVQMHQPQPSVKRLWPTLEGRLRQPLTSRADAIRQLQTMIPITPLAQAVLQRSQSAKSPAKSPAKS